MCIQYYNLGSERSIIRAISRDMSNKHAQHSTSVSLLSFHSVIRIACSNFAYTYYEIATKIKPYISVIQLRDRHAPIHQTGHFEGVRVPTHTYRN
jgi:hypothetical protein